MRDHMENENVNEKENESEDGNGKEDDMEKDLPYLWEQTY